MMNLTHFSNIMLNAWYCIMRTLIKLYTWFFCKKQPSWKLLGGHIIFPMLSRTFVSAVDSDVEQIAALFITVSPHEEVVACHNLDISDYRVKHISKDENEKDFVDCRKFKVNNVSFMRCHLVKTWWDAFSFYGIPTYMYSAKVQFNVKDCDCNFYTAYVSHVYSTNVHGTLKREQTFQAGSENDLIHQIQWYALGLRSPHELLYLLCEIRLHHSCAQQCLNTGRIFPNRSNKKSSIPYST